MVEAGSWDTNLPLSKTTRIRAVPSGEESSTVTFSFASLPLTSIASRWCVALTHLLGHSDVKMTMRYYNMNKKTIDKARDILDRRALVVS